MALSSEKPQLPPEYSQFRRLWTQGKYFECHEVLEVAWRREADPQLKQLLQGLIHAAVALVHVERENPRGASRQLAKAEAKLQPFGDEYGGCDIGSLLRTVALRVEAQREREGSTPADGNDGDTKR